MGLRIQNNIAAMNAHKNLQISDSAMSKSLQRLSSGYRINNAADDAAGLAISQGFRADIASFKVASRNTSEASAMLQVAEGGMDQIGNMLTRLKELATQAASANVGSSERTKINAEATALTSEIDRIANSTKYGSTALLTGTFGASQTGALGAAAVTNHVNGIVDDSADNVSYDFVDSAAAGAMASSVKVTALGAGVTEGTYTIAQITTGVITIANSSGTVSESYSGALTGDTLTFANLGITITVTGSTLGGAVGFSAGAAATTLTLNRTGLTSLNISQAEAGTYDITQAAAGVIRVTNSAGTASQLLSFQSSDTTLDFNVLGISFKLGAGFSNATTELDGMQITVAANTSAAGNVFQVGAQNNSDNQISLAIGGVGTASLGLTGLDLSTATGAQTALDTIDSAVSTLSGLRGDVGASMNRLSYAAANLATTIENTQAAESVIRDVDMASEMTDFTKNQILLQAGTAMLAQANMAPQGILSLLK
ncbi:MAG: flagellin [Desulfobacterales bacterium]